MFLKVNGYLFLEDLMVLKCIKGGTQSLLELCLDDRDFTIIQV